MKKEGFVKSAIKKIVKGNYILKRLIFRLRSDGIKKILKEFIFFNKTIIIVEKDITGVKLETGEDIEIAIINKGNYNSYRRIRGIENLSYYCKIGAECIAAIQNGKAAGFQWLTQDNSFSDLKLLNLELKAKEAYLFDLFILPDYRGTKIPLAIINKTFEYLLSKGVCKVYGFFF